MRMHLALFGGCRSCRGGPWLYILVAAKFRLYESEGRGEGASGFLTMNLGR